MDKSIVYSALVTLALSSALYLALFFGLKDSINDDSLSNTENCGYSACPVSDPNKLNIHIVPHTHDDTGWIISVDGYYEEEVKFIFYTLIPALESNPDRKFIYVEMAFFTRFWNSVSDGMKDRIRKLVKNGQLSFSLGHWSMPDEATPYYADLITNAQIGMRFLEHNFGECGRPLNGWQIDPFGHSEAVSKLYKELGYDSLFIGRIHYEDYKTRSNSGEMEFIWNGVFTSVNANVYKAPPSFNFDKVYGDGQSCRTE